MKSEFCRHQTRLVRLELNLMIYLLGAGTDKTADVVFKLHALNSSTNNGDVGHFGLKAQ